MVSLVYFVFCITDILFVIDMMRYREKPIFKTKRLYELMPISATCRNIFELSTHPY